MSRKTRQRCRVVCRKLEGVHVCYIMRPLNAWRNLCWVGEFAQYARLWQLKQLRLPPRLQVGEWTICQHRPRGAGKPPRLAMPDNGGTSGCFLVCVKAAIHNPVVLARLCWPAGMQPAYLPVIADNSYGFAAPSQHEAALVQLKLQAYLNLALRHHRNYMVVSIRDLRGMIAMYPNSSAAYAAGIYKTKPSYHTAVGVYLL